MVTRNWKGLVMCLDDIAVLLRGYGLEVSCGLVDCIFTNRKQASRGDMVLILIHSSQLEVANLTRSE